MTMHALADGSTLRVRALRPTDQAALRAAFRELSPESRYQRFLAHMGELSDAMWERLCDVDGRDHVAVVAVTEDDSRILGVARFVRLALDPEAAEFAVTVVDAWQLRGVGSLLLGALAPAARARGVRSFVAYALPQNLGVRRLMARFGALGKRRLAGDEVLSLHLREDPDESQDWPMPTESSRLAV
jgi:RimJ/RimL family protein N-acetyltransferase